MAMSAGGDPSRPEMNVTPLIDVLLVLIIIFMVIVTLGIATFVLDLCYPLIDPRITYRKG